jgi:alpha-glucuronidase
VRDYRRTWASLRNYVDEERFADVTRRLQIQEEDAVWWRDACLLYFQTFSRRSFPAGVQKAVHQLDTLRTVQLPISNFECPTEAQLKAVR